MRMSILAERVENDWVVSLLAPHVARVMEAYGTKSEGSSGGGVVLVADNKLRRCELYEPRVQIKLHEPDG